MQHVAIMKKSWGLLPKIASGTKTIESRWYLNRSAPWGKVSTGDVVYFKNSGEPVTVQAKVKKVLSFEDLTPQKVKEILDEWGRADGLEHNQVHEYYELFKNKRYCLLIFISGAKQIKPFNINKTGFGSQAAWLCADSIDQIKC
jgi:ASC-1-like (ASCH) protein